MLAVLFVLLFLAGGAWLGCMLLPGRRPLVRLYTGLSFGILLMMWLPALWAHAVCFSYAAHWLSVATLLLLCGLGWLLRDKRKPLPFNAKEERLALDLLWMVVPLTILGGFLQYTHSIRPAADGAYHVGQSTYGDLSLHLAVATSIDALAAGITLAVLKTPILPSVSLIGTVTFFLCAAGVATGFRFGSKYERAAQILGGSVLIIIGMKILLEHLGILSFPF